MVTLFSPHQIVLGGFSFPPLLMSGLLALACTSITVRILNKKRWHRFFVSPPLVELSLTIIYTVLIGTFVIPS